MSLNHKAYIAVTVTFMSDGVQYMMLLDIVEVAKSHSDINLAATFAKILDNFGVSDKVNYIFNEL
jgi:hypothetical protein